jgi:outer membrane protein assembly factor BamD (BamD/ComL family)
MGLFMRKFTLLLLMMSLALAVGCSRKMSEEQLYEEAKKLEQQQDIDKLIKVYEELVDRFPKSQKADFALYKLALVYQNNKQDFKKAVACHERLMKDYPQSKYVSQSHFMSAFIYANDLKDIEKARAVYKSFIETYPKHELVPSVKWEIEHLGQDINDIELFAKTNAPKEEKPLAQSGNASKGQTAKKPTKP